MIIFLRFVEVVEFGLNNKNVAKFDKSLNFLLLFKIPIWGRSRLRMTSNVVFKRMSFSFEKQFE